MEKLKLIESQKEWRILFLASFIIIALQIGYKYYQFLQFKSNPIYKTQATIINNYPKRKNNQTYYILKLEDKNNDMLFYTSINKLIKNSNITIWLVTKHVSFLDFIKGFYAPNIYYKDSFEQNLKDKIANKIRQSHKNGEISQIFNAIFLAIPTSNILRDKFSALGISHLIAISGFHLGVIIAIIFGIFYLPYSFFHNRYFPYRHKRNDLLFITDMFLLGYLFLIGDIPSVIRAYVMFSLGYMYYKNHIKIVSFENLAITFIIVITFFPTFIFSYSFWFSIAGVFYIFLFLHYFKFGFVKNFIFLNFWVFFAFNPIIHFFFGTTSFVQLLSPILTMAFSIFFPIEILLHLIGYADLLDSLLLKLINYPVSVYQIVTPSWFFVLYIIVSFLAIFRKTAFNLLNMLMLLFNFYIFKDIFNINI